MYDRDLHYKRFRKKTGRTREEILRTSNAAQSPFVSCQRCDTPHSYIAQVSLGSQRTTKVRGMGHELARRANSIFLRYRWWGRHKTRCLGRSFRDRLLRHGDENIDLDMIPMYDAASFAYLPWRRRAGYRRRESRKRFVSEVSGKWLERHDTGTKRRFKSFSLSHRENTHHKVLPAIHPLFTELCLLFLRKIKVPKFWYCRYPSSPLPPRTRSTMT